MFVHLLTSGAVWGRTVELLPLMLKAPFFGSAKSLSAKDACSRSASCEVAVRRPGETNAEAGSITTKTERIAAREILVTDMLDDRSSAE